MTAIVSIELSKTNAGIAVSCEVEGILGVPDGERRETVYGDPDELLDWIQEWLSEPVDFGDGNGQYTPTPGGRL